MTSVEVEVFCVVGGKIYRQICHRASKLPVQLQGSYPSCSEHASSSGCEPSPRFMSDTFVSREHPIARIRLHD